MSQESVRRSGFLVRPYRWLGSVLFPLSLSLPLSPQSLAQVNAPEVYSRREDNPERESHFGYRAHTLDLDGDGIQDIAVSALRSGFFTGKLGEAWFLRGPRFETMDYLPDPDPQLLGGYGSDLAHGDLDGDGIVEVLVGAAFKDSSSDFDVGEVFIYSGYPLQAVKLLRSTSPNALARFGWDLAIGDIDADGFQDIAVGAPFDQSGGIGAGRVHVFFGPDQIRSRILELARPTLLASLGESVLIADLDADGFDDVISGASRHDIPGIAKAGSVLIAYGPDFMRMHAIESSIPESGALFGNFSCEGDFTGDGYTDLLISSYDHSVNGIEGAGIVEVFPGPAFTSSFVLRSTDPRVNAHFGTYLDLGSIDGDSRLDLVVGARDDTQGSERFTGATYVFFGRDSSQPEILLDPTPIVRAGFGHVALIEDMNADGLGEVIVTGHLDRPNGIPEQGEFHVFDFSTRRPFVSYGQGSPGAGSFVPTLFGTGLLKPGTTSQITLANSRGGATGVLLVGLGRASTEVNVDVIRWVDRVSLAVPFILDGPNGAPGLGTMNWPVTLSPQPSLAGISLKLQGLVLDDDAASGLSSTPGLSITIQP